MSCSKRETDRQDILEGRGRSSTIIAHISVGSLGSCIVGQNKARQSQSEPARVTVAPRQMDLDHDEDVIRWQGSQSPCPALEGLLKESLVSERQVSVPEYRSSLWDLSSLSPTPASSSSLSRLSPNSSSGQNTRTRPPGLRSGRAAAAAAASPPLSQERDPSQLIALIQGVSAQVDDNTQKKTRLLARGRDTKRAAREWKEDKRSVSRSANGRKGTTMMVPVESHRSLPDPGAAMDVDQSTDSKPKRSRTSSHSGDATMSSPKKGLRRAIENPSSSQTRMPPPPVPVPKSDSQMYSPAESVLHAPRLSSSPPIKLHPLLTNPNRPLYRQHQPKPSQPRVQRPRTSQTSSRPPVLGMRRAAPSSSSPSSSSSQTLPSKQKTFKTPFMKQQQPPTAFETRRSSSPSRATEQRPQGPGRIPSPKSSPDPTSPLTPPISGLRNTSPQEVTGGLEDSPMDTDPVTKKRSSSPIAETDSSFGDMSFDLDALEETMKMYD